MDQQRWKLIETLFDQALQRDQTERHEFLRAACAGDLELLAEVEALLTHDDQVGAQSFLQGSARRDEALLFAAAVEDPYIGMQLGPYVIKRRHASGGMGNVYLAQRQADFRQQVSSARPPESRASKKIEAKQNYELKHWPNVSRLNCFMGSHMTSPWL